MKLTKLLPVFLALALSGCLGERILLIGDSHTAQTFGHVLDRRLRRLPETQVATYASCGSNPYSWFVGWPTNCGYFYKDYSEKTQEGLSAPTPLLKDLLTRLRPTVTLVALGANLMNGPLEFAMNTTREMAKMIHDSGSRCVWIGPPHARIFDPTKFAALYGVLKEASPECQFIDTRSFAHYPDVGGDGLHYDRIEPDGPGISTALANSVFQALLELNGSGPVGTP